MSKQREEALRLFKENSIIDNPYNWHLWKKAFDLGASFNNTECKEKVKPLLTALIIFADGDPISVGLDEVKEVAQNAIDYWNETIE